MVHDNFGKLFPQVEPEDALAYGVGDLHLLPGEGKIPFGKVLKLFGDVPILLKVKDPREVPENTDEAGPYRPAPQSLSPSLFPISSYRTAKAFPIVSFFLVKCVTSSLRF